MSDVMRARMDMHPSWGQPIAPSQWPCHAERLTILLSCANDREWPNGLQSLMMLVAEYAAPVLFIRHMHEIDLLQWYGECSYGQISTAANVGDIHMDVTWPLGHNKRFTDQSSGVVRDLADGELFQQRRWEWCVSAASKHPLPQPFSSHRFDTWASILSWLSDPTNVKQNEHFARRVRDHAQICYWVWLPREFNTIRDCLDPLYVLSHQLSAPSSALVQCARDYVSAFQHIRPRCIFTLDHRDPNNKILDISCVLESHVGHLSKELQHVRQAFREYRPNSVDDLL